jgi:AraC-like DNA-binding protein
MKLLHTEITTFINDVISIELRDQNYLVSPFFTQPSFHAHPELELVCILEGFGKRIIGNRVQSFTAGDMVFVGSNVPHVWLSDPAFYEEGSRLHSKVIVAYFNPQVFHQLFASIKELNPINSMIKDAARGIRITGDTQKIIAKKLIEISSKTGFEKVEGMLRILHTITISEDREFILPDNNGDNWIVNSDKVIEVVRFIHENFDKRVTLKEAAEIACMTEQSFCRFFKSRTKKSFSQYVEDLRVAHAKKMLIEMDTPISDIAYSCGYKSSSHFCKVFKDHTGQTPNQFRADIIVC